MKCLRSNGALAAAWIINMVINLQEPSKNWERAPLCVTLGRGRELGMSRSSDHESQRHESMPCRRGTPCDDRPAARSTPAAHQHGREAAPDKHGGGALRGDQSVLRLACGGRLCRGTGELYVGRSGFRALSSGTVATGGVVKLRAGCSNDHKRQGRERKRYTTMQPMDTLLTLTALGLALSVTQAEDEKPNATVKLSSSLLQSAAR